MSGSLEVVLRSVMIRPPHRRRLFRGLGLGFTPRDVNGRCKLMLSRRPEKRVEFGVVVQVVVYPSEKEVEIVKRSLKEIIGDVAFETLKNSVKSEVNGHGCVALFWYDVAGARLL